MRPHLGVWSWIGIAGVLTFVAGVSFGFLGAGFLGHESDETFAESSAAPSFEVLDTFTNEHVWTRIGLSPDRRAEANRIVNAQYKRLKELREERDALSRRVEEEISALLNEEQKEKFRTLRTLWNVEVLADAVAQRVGRFKVELNLNQQQTDAFHSIFLDDRLAKDDVMRECSGSREEIRTRHKKLSEERDLKVREILSDEQWVKYRALDEKKRQWWERSPFGGGRGPKPEKKPPEPGAPPPPEAKPAAP